MRVKQVRNHCTIILQCTMYTVNTFTQFTVICTQTLQLSLPHCYSVLGVVQLLHVAEKVPQRMLLVSSQDRQEDERSLLVSGRLRSPRPGQEEQTAAEESNRTCAEAARHRWLVSSLASSANRVKASASCHTLYAATTRGEPCNYFMPSGAPLSEYELGLKSQFRSPDSIKGATL